MSKKQERRQHRYAMGKALLLDRIDEYCDEIERMKQGALGEQQCQALLGRIGQSCRKDAVHTLRFAPKAAESLRKDHILLLLGSWLRVAMLPCAGAAVIGGFVSGRVLLHVLIAMIFGVLALMFHRAVQLTVERFLYHVVMDVYEQRETTWTEEQKRLIPKRLLPYVHPLQQAMKLERSVHAQLVCSCGSHRFIVYRHPEQNYLTAVCAGCKREITVFDEHLDAYQADQQEQFYYPRDLQFARCRLCGGDYCFVSLTIVSDEQGTFFGETSPEDVEAQDCGYLYQVRMTCAGCGEDMGEGVYVWTGEQPEAQEQEEEQMP